MIQQARPQDGNYSRTLWWCQIIAEPTILEFKDGKPRCACCDWIDNDATADGAPSPAFESQHTYMAKIGRPYALEKKA